MREIKLRAWDGYSVKILEGYASINNGAIDMDDTRVVELMQYTGLKDKNGVEIYEGDIVKTLRDVFAIEYGEKDFGFIFWLNSHGGWMSLPYLVGLKDFKVIGNIYENKELLNV